MRMFKLLCLFGLIVATTLLLMGRFNDELQSVTNERVDVVDISAVITANAPKAAVDRVKAVLPVAANTLELTSLSGTHPDGQINLDSAGQVIVDRDLRRYFDYYLTMVGELSIEQIRTMMLKHVSGQLNLDQMEVVRDQFDEYIRYLDQFELWASVNTTNLTLSEQLQVISAFREQWFGDAVAAAFFGEEEQYASHVLGELDDQGKALSWLLQEEAATAYQDALIQVESDLSSEQLQQQRVESFGAEAAARLAVLDQQRTDWNDLVDEYINQRQQLELSGQLTTQNLAVLESDYSNQDLKRLRAMWQLKQPGQN